VKDYVWMGFRMMTGT